MMKWALVVAGLGDLARPAEKLSASQNTALAVTGFIWVRYVATYVFLGLYSIGTASSLRPSTIRSPPSTSSSAQQV